MIGVGRVSKNKRDHVLKNKLNRKIYPVLQTNQREKYPLWRVKQICLEKIVQRVAQVHVTEGVSVYKSDIRLV